MTILETPPAAKPQSSAPPLTPERQARATEAMREYLIAPTEADGKTPKERQTHRDQMRVELTESKLKPLLLSFLRGEIPLDQFKSTNDSINKSNNVWGFKGVKGQMFFNLVVNVADDVNECCQELKAAMAVPANDDIARSRIRNFHSYVKRIGEQHVERGGSKQGRPKVSSVPFFLSYFWQIQDRLAWPVYYTNGVNTMTDLNLWQPSGDLADDYIEYKRIYQELARLFTQTSGEPFGFYEVEHVFWYKGGSPFDSEDTTPPGTVKPIGLIHPKMDDAVIGNEPLIRLPESFVPPIVAVLPRIARNDEQLIEIAKASGSTVERAFEKNINATFTILGYETKLLGQGQGRVPDGLAIATDERYGIIWDAKVRCNGYSMGTDDRAIREYIVTQSRDLKKRRGLRNVYYAIVSSCFADDYDDAIRSLKMETDIDEVCLVEAEALVAMVDAKLRDPQQASLGSDGLQRLFSQSGLMTADDVRETLL
ncbi:MAG: hypothetical protein L0Z53_13380 [Acidobacteriales bacterium]|nr:hypothetical protein [Terriglobales bacterium]